MKKKLVFIYLLCILSLLTLTGCHGAKSMDAFVIPDDFDTSREYNITFWAKNDTNAVQTAIYEKAVSEFEALYPNIDVTIRLYNDYSKIYNDVITNISTGTTPNVCITYPDHIATYLQGANTVVNLTELIDHEEYGLAGSKLLFDGPSRAEMVPEFLEECRLGDELYAVPYMRSTEAMYINKDFVEALGYEVPDVLTWDFVFEVSEKAMAKNSDGTFSLNNQNVLIPFIYKSTDNCMIQLLRQANAGYSDINGNILIFNDTTKGFLKEFSDSAKIGAFSTFKISSYPANFLNAGQCIFAVDSTAGSTWMGTDAPLLDIAAENVVKFETVVRPVPQLNPATPQMISQGPSVCIFNKEDSEEVLASWLFTQYLLTNSIQIPYAETEGYVPVTLKAQNAPEYKDYLSRGGEDNELYYSIKVDATKLLIDNVNNTFITPVFNGSTSLRDAAGALIESVTKAAKRNQTVDDAYIEKLYSDTRSLYHLSQGSKTLTGNEDLGPLPPASKALLIILVVTWILIGAYYALNNIKKQNK